jgi:uncharacterized protein (DUF4415 family)
LTKCAAAGGDVLAAFRAMGTGGWQAKMDDALREWLRTHNAV